MILFGLSIIVTGLGAWWFSRPAPQYVPPVVPATEDQIKEIKRLAKQIYDRFGGNDQNRWNDLLVLGHTQGVTCDLYCIHVEYIHRFKLRVYFKNDTINKNIKKGDVTFTNWPEGIDATLEEFTAQQIIYSLQAVIASMTRPTLDLN